MQVKLTTSRASSAASNAAGDVIDLPENEARHLIESGQAIPVVKQQERTAESSQAKKRVNRKRR